MSYSDIELIKGVDNDDVKFIKKVFKFNPQSILGCRCSLLRYAIKKGSIRVFDFFLSKNFSSGGQLLNNDVLDDCLEDGDTLLHFAVQFGSIDIIKYLIKKGYDVNVQNIYGNTPLHCIIWSQRFDLKEEVIKILLLFGALVNIQDRWGNTPFHLAVWQGNLKIIAMLFAKGVNLEIQDRWGNTPLHIASKIGNKSIMSFIMSRNKVSCFDVKDKWGNPVKNIKDNENIVKYLFDYGSQDTNLPGLKEKKMHCGCCLLFF